VRGSHLGCFTPGKGLMNKARWAPKCFEIFEVDKNYFSLTGIHPESSSL
jgi:hypothetical protein